MKQWILYFSWSIFWLTLYLSDIWSPVSYILWRIAIMCGMTGRLPRIQFGRLLGNSWCIHGNLRQRNSWWLYCISHYVTLYYSTREERFMHLCIHIFVHQWFDVHTFEDHSNLKLKVKMNQHVSYPYDYELSVSHSPHRFHRHCCILLGIPLVISENYKLRICE